MVFIKKSFNHIVLSMKTFNHIVFHGYKKTIRHKNMAYMTICMTRKWSLIIFVLVINVKFWHSGICRIYISNVK
jgi:hypothetical protein